MPLLLDLAFRRVLRHYRVANYDYRHPRKADGQCFVVSVDFQEALDAAGLLDDAERGKRWDVVKVFEIFDGTPAHYMADKHWVFRWGDIAIDWTARQFRKDAPFPALYRLNGAWDDGNMAEQ